MRKCASCASKMADDCGWMWQPCGPAETVASFTLPGSHYRGFVAVRICDSCKEAIERGEPREFTYRGRRFEARDSSVIEIVAPKSSSRVPA